MIEESIWDKDLKKYVTGIHYRWAGDWKKSCWFEVDGKTYHVTKNYPYFITTGTCYAINYPDESDWRLYYFDRKGVLQEDYAGPALYNGKQYFFKDGELFHKGTANYGIAQGTDGYYYFIEGGGVILTGTNKWVGLAGDGTDWTHELVDTGTYTFDAYGRLINNLLTGKTSIKDQTAKEGDKTEIIGRVLSLTRKLACKVMYKDSAGKYHLLEAMINPYGASTIALEDPALEYNFIIPKDAKEVKILISGDVSGDGKITNEDVLFMIEAFRDPTKLTDEQMYVADVDGDGRITAADIAYINAVVKKGIELDW
jgi:hypothetical protein